MSNKITIFNADITKDITQAIKSLVTGTTPVKEVKKRTIRGGDEAYYVNTYYMTRQASLITGFRWSSKCLMEKYIPNEQNPIEIGALIEVSLFDNDGKAYIHQSWGGAEVFRYNKDQHKDGKLIHKAGDIISIFDSVKSAYSDGIKKCLSYFGIANDIYGGRELNYFEEATDENGKAVSAEIISTSISTSDLRTAFDKYVVEHHVRYDIVLRLLNAQNMAEITDYMAAYKIVKEYVEGGKKAI